MSEALSAREHLAALLDRLWAARGKPEHDGPDDVLGTLVETILSQATSDANSTRAFGQLLERFEADWEQIRRAPTSEVAEAIRCGGLANQKAPRIQAILAQVHDDRADYDLEFLHECQAGEAMAYLTRFRGVGPKTARFTLMWAAGMDVFPMDTHIFRILERVGLLDPSLSDEAAHRAMEALLAADQSYPAHVALVDHGRRVCHARGPECGGCPLRPLCAHGEVNSAPGK